MLFREYGEVISRHADLNAHASTRCIVVPDSIQMSVRIYNDLAPDGLGGEGGTRSVRNAVGAMLQSEPEMAQRFSFELWETPLERVKIGPSSPE